MRVPDKNIVYYKSEPSTLLTKLRLLWFGAIYITEKFPESSKNFNEQICLHNFTQKV